MITWKFGKKNSTEPAPGTSLRPTFATFVTTPPLSDQSWLRPWNTAVSEIRSLFLKEVSRNVLIKQRIYLREVNACFPLCLPTCKILSWVQNILGNQRKVNHTWIQFTYYIFIYDWLYPIYISFVAKPIPENLYRCQYSKSCDLKHQRHPTVCRRSTLLPEICVGMFSIRGVNDSTMKLPQLHNVRS